MSHDVKNYSTGNDSTYTTTPNSAKTEHNSLLIDVLTSLETPAVLSDSLSLMFNEFLSSETADDKNTRLDTHKHFTILNDFLTELDNLKTA